MNQANHKERTPYAKKLFWRKVRMYGVWVLTFIACLIVSLFAFNRRFFEINEPQIKRAYVFGGTSAVGAKAFAACQKATMQAKAQAAV